MWTLNSVQRNAASISDGIFLLNVSMDFRIFPVADLQKGSLLLVQVEGSLINSDLYD